MVFSSLTFLCVFLPVVLALYYAVPALRAKNILLTVVSLLFYAYGEPVYVLLMLFSITANWIFGRMLETDHPHTRKAVVILAVCVNLGLLGIFKYADMVILTANQIFHSNIKTVGLALPVGISFFTFQALSYVIDVYRGETLVQKKLGNVMLYISFFPQLIAGPIVKYHDIQRQIDERHFSMKETAEGMRRFLIGLSKKVLISNVAARVTDTLFAAGGDGINLLSAWLAAVAYMLQIYYDFSGYSDMAIGLGKMFGFHFLENFNYPYISKNIQEFWRRWHISLSTWFKEYLYIPLGGNRKGKVRTCINKMIVFFATGLWHGADWTFVAWGMWHGLFILLEEVLPIKKLPRILGQIYTMFVVAVGFVMFRADTFRQGMWMLGKMFGGWTFTDASMSVMRTQLRPLVIVTFIIGIVFAAPVIPKLKGWQEKVGEKGRPAEAASYVYSLLLLVLCLLNLSSGTYNPFIYFRF